MTHFRTIKDIHLERLVFIPTDYEVVRIAVQELGLGVRQPYSASLPALEILDVVFLILKVAAGVILLRSSYLHLSILILLRRPGDRLSATGWLDSWCDRREQVLGAICNHAWYGLPIDV